MGAHQHHNVPRPELSRDRIAYSHERKREMAAYSERHYGHREWRLRNPKVIVLHFTDGPSWQSARSEFARNAPNLGELPGVCSHFIVDQGGTIHLIVPARIRCRHTIGLNHTAVGIEMVQEAPAGSHAADLAILHRRAQIHRALHLTAFLMQKFGIPRREVIGHAMANGDRHFRDLEGWTNDHTDWLAQDVKRFRERLRARYHL
jgi:N-acetyl-anhydromuramyl-L-alanine amidase AmpD